MSQPARAGTNTSRSSDHNITKDNTRASLPWSYSTALSRWDKDYGEKTLRDLDLSLGDEYINLFFQHDDGGFDRQMKGKKEEKFMWKLI